MTDGTGEFSAKTDLKQASEGAVLRSAGSEFQTDTRGQY